jgi:hypothetical protein
MQHVNSVLTQNAYVVRDVQASMHQWINTMGIGPFFLLDHINLQNVEYRGTAIELDISAAIAFSGSVQIELIQQHSDGPSAYRDVVPEGSEGFHHICIYPEDYDRSLADYEAAGMPLAMKGEIASSGGRFCYMDARSNLNCMMELVDVPDGGAGALWAPLRQATDEWDGKTDPIRLMDL